MAVTGITRGVLLGILEIVAGHGMGARPYAEELYGIRHHEFAL